MWDDVVGLLRMARWVTPRRLAALLGWLLVLLMAFVPAVRDGIVGVFEDRVADRLERLMPDLPAAPRGGEVGAR